MSWCCGNGILYVTLGCLFLTAGIVGAVLVARLMSNRRREGDHGQLDTLAVNEAEATLEQRFARGEIDREEFEERARAFSERR